MTFADGFMFGLGACTACVLFKLALDVGAAALGALIDRYL